MPSNHSKLWSWAQHSCAQVNMEGGGREGWARGAGECGHATTPSCWSWAQHSCAQVGTCSSSSCAPPGEGGCLEGGPGVVRGVIGAGKRGHATTPSCGDGHGTRVLRWAGVAHWSVCRRCDMNEVPWFHNVPCCAPRFYAGAMGLPVSGFHNMNAVSLEDPTACSMYGY
jgi:hypothetical protein